MSTIELLKELSEIIGPSGFEEQVRENIESKVASLVDEVRTDALGNLIATRRGSSDKVLMIDAHMDEIGFMISFVESSGFLRIVPIGGWDVRILPSHTITFVAKDGGHVSGVIGTPPPHILTPKDRERPYPMDELFVDIGATSAEHVDQLGLHIGSPGTISYPFERMNERTVRGKALDDRAGCAVLIKTLEALQGKDLDITVAAAFVVAEEVGLRGAQTAAYQIDPDLAIALEGTVAADVPGIADARQPTRMGQGPSISVMDNSMIVQTRMVNAMTAIAENHDIPYQFKLPATGGTDAGIIHRSRAGVISGVISVPCRYIHSPHSMLNLDDFESAVELTTAFAEDGPAVLGL